MERNFTQIKDLLKCPVCFDLYHDPYILPCSHVLCRSCIEKILRNKRNKSTFNCPMCRHKIDFKGFGINGLERDTTTALMVEAAVRAKNRQMAKKDLMENKCKTHNKPEKIYCGECNMLVCTSCATDGRHDSHKLNEAEEVTEKGKEWICAQLERLTKYRDESLEKIKDCETQTSGIKADASDLWYLMEETFGRMKSDLLRREEELKEWLQKQVEQCESMNRAFIISLEENVDSLNAFIQHLQDKIKEESVSFVKSFDTTKKRLLDTVYMERNRKNPSCYPSDALSAVEFKYADWRMCWPNNVEDITLAGTIKLLNEHKRNMEPTINKQTITLQTREIYRQNWVIDRRLMLRSPSSLRMHPRHLDLSQPSTYKREK